MTLARYVVKALTTEGHLIFIRIFCRSDPRFAQVFFCAQKSPATGGQGMGLGLQHAVAALVKSFVPSRYVVFGLGQKCGVVCVVLQHLGQKFGHAVLGPYN